MRLLGFAVAVTVGLAVLSWQRLDGLYYDELVRAWYRWVSAAYLRGYREATAGAAFLPSDAGEWATVLDAMLFLKAFYELGYELNNRPDWVAIPLRGIAQLLES